MIGRPRFRPGLRPQADACAHQRAVDADVLQEHDAGSTKRLEKDLDDLLADRDAALVPPHRGDGHAGPLRERPLGPAEQFPRGLH